MTISTTSPAARKTTVNLKDPGQLLAATPQLLGFRPAESLILIGHSPPRGDRVGLALRGDLPPRGLLRTQAECLVTVLAGSEAVGATIVVVGRRPNGPARDPARVPYATLVDTVTEVLAGAGIRAMHALWVPEISSGAPWACYADRGCRGVLPDVGSTVAAATMASSGVVTYGSREEMLRLLDPADEAVLARRSALLTASCGEESAHPDVSDESTGLACAAVRAALRRAERHDLDLTDEQAVELAIALANPRVRDACLATAAAAGGTALAAERLWLALVRALPAPERAEAACLLGYAAYLRGDGALAGMALENALAAVPGHILGALLLSALRHGISPDRLSGLGRQDRVANLSTGAG